MKTDPNTPDNTFTSAWHDLGKVVKIGRSLPGKILRPIVMLVMLIIMYPVPAMLKAALGIQKPK